jgi:hypothetical protein
MSLPISKNICETPDALGTVRSWQTKIRTSIDHLTKDTYSVIMSYGSIVQSVRSTRAAPQVRRFPIFPLGF